MGDGEQLEAVRRRRLITLALALFLALATQTCGGGPSSPTAPQTLNVATLIVTGWLQPLRVDDAVQMTATAILSDGSSRSVTNEAAWETSDPDIATVHAGLVTARAEGMVSIIARHSGRSGEQLLTVERGNIPSTGLTCGVERWAVKTLSDPAASSVDMGRVVTTTIRELNELPTRCSGLPSARTFPEEFVTYEVVGRIIYAASEDDRDYHVSLADPSDPSYTVVTEVADTACSGAINSPHRDAMGAARISFMAMLNGHSPSVLIGTTVRVRGVGFFDFNHGQIGRSQNCMELHPLTMIDRVQ